MDIPVTEIGGRKYITVDGIRLLRKALGLPDIKKPVEFLGNLKGWQEYMKGVRQETLKACHPGLLEEYQAD